MVNMRGTHKTKRKNEEKVAEKEKTKQKEIIISIRKEPEISSALEEIAVSAVKAQEPFKKRPIVPDST